MIIVTATLSFETQADRDRAVELTTDVQRATRDDEPGCLAYCFGADPAVPEHIQVYELWTDADSLAEHFEHPNYAAMVDVLRNVGGFVASHNQLYAAEFRGPVYDENGFRRAAVADQDGSDAHRED